MYMSVDVPCTYMYYIHVCSCTMYVKLWAYFHESDLIFFLTNNFNPLGVTPDLERDFDVLVSAGDVRLSLDEVLFKLFMSCTDFDGLIKWYPCLVIGDMASS